MKPYIKYLIISAAIALTACNSGGGEDAATVSQTAAAVAEMSETEASSETETTARTENESAVTEATEPEYAEVSPNNVFIDYKLIDDYQPTNITSTLGAKAVDFLAESEYYAETEKQLDLFTGEEFKEFFDEGGNIVPKLRAAYPEDYDGDGKTETFILADMPYEVGIPVVRSFIIFADSDENMTVLGNTCGLYPIELLDYGSFKQIIIGGTGVAGADDVKLLYGVKDGKAEQLYAIRGMFSKCGCFLSTFGWQGSGDFMYYDTAAKEYRGIAGEEVPFEDIKAMDRDNALEEYYDAYEETGYWDGQLLGKKYYVFSLGAMDFGTAYKYIDGKFVQTEDCENIRISSGLTLTEKPVKDIDIDKALSEMISISEYAEVSPDNVFIDYKLIEDYQPTDITSTLEAKAVDFLAESEYYAETEKQLDLFTDEEFKEFFDEGGNIVPKLRAAYPEDYDGDGKTETFLFVDMPCTEGLPVVRSFVIFADSDENMTLIHYTCNLYPTELLDYGSFKQIIIGGSGIFGAEDVKLLYGVKDGKAEQLYGIRGSYSKFDCFLVTHGWQGSGDFMYYDTSAGEYRAVMGEPVSIEDIKAMDKYNALADHYNAYEKTGFWDGRLLGKKYYIFAEGNMDFGTAYEYKNGKFVQTENCKNVRLSEGRDANKVMDIDIDKALSEMISIPEYAEVSPDNVFIDYKFIEDCRSSESSLADKAVEFMKNSEQYRESTENISEFTDKKFAPYFDKDGNIVPKLHAAYTEDYDGDGRKESFLIVDMPFKKDYTEIQSYFIFADSGGNMTLLFDNCNLYPTKLLDYGAFKQIIVGGSGNFGVEDCTFIYGVKDGKAEKKYEIRGGFEKLGCFLAADGWQGMGGFMYYDTAAEEYRNIVGEDISLEDIKTMDKDSALEGLYDGSIIGARCLGKKYYIFVRGPMDTGTGYEYKDGRFVQTEDSKKTRLSGDVNHINVKDIDIDKALSEMISAEDAAFAQAEAVSHTFVEVSPDNVFIDFKFNKDYKGTAVGEPLTEKAAAFLKTTNEYADSQSQKETYKEDFPEYFDKDGNILPIASVRFTEDFDGDGKTESFLTVDMPCYSNPAELRSFVLFADSENNLTPVEDSYGLCSYNTRGLQPFQLLDYGSFKQLIIEGIGVVGAGSHTEIYGVIDGKPKILDTLRGSYRKTGFMLGSFGWMHSGATMYYDTAAKEYRNIVGKEINYRQIMEMDTTNVFEEYTAEYSGGKSVGAVLIGGKYYCAGLGPMGPKLVCTYENGVFVPVPDDSAVRYTEHNSYRNNVVNIDIDKALSEMITVE